MLYVNPVLTQGAEQIDSPQRRREALQEFERLYLREMLKTMRQALPDGGLYEKSQQQQFFKEMLDDALAGKMAESGQFGLAEQMERQLEQQEAAMKLRNEPGMYAAGLSVTSSSQGLSLHSPGEGALDRSVPWPAVGLPMASEDLPANVQNFLHEADKQGVR
jgi:flagellar protein FlgJ